MKATRSRWVAVAAALTLSFCQIAAAHAQDAAYPNRPIKMLVGFGAGGGTDIAARIMAQKMSEILSIAIARRQRGRGFARPLLDLHLRRLAGLGTRAVFLEVDENNAPARALYRRAGFRDVGRRQSYYQSGASALVLRRDLG